MISVSNMDNIASAVLMVLAIVTSGGAEDVSNYTIPATFEMFYNHTFEVWHIANDVYRPAFIIFSDGSSMRSLNTQTMQPTNLIGDAKSHSYTEGIGSEARFNIISGFVQVNVTHTLLVDHGNHCIRSMVRERLSDRSSVIYNTSNLVGLCGTSGSNFGVGTEARFSHPSKIIRSPSENKFFVSDFNNLLIKELNIDTLEVVYWHSVYTSPAGMTLADSGILYIMTSRISWVHRIIKEFSALSSTREVTESLEFGYQDGAAYYALFENPQEIEYLDRHLLIAADKGNNKLRVVDLTTYTVYTLCDASKAGVDTTRCELREPQAVVINADGSFLVGTSKGIWKVKPSFLDEDIEINTNWTSGYHIIPELYLGKMTSVAFTVEACSDAKVSLRQSSDLSSDAYEILLGSMNNTGIVIIRPLGGDTNTILPHQSPLDCDTARPFWISWDGGVVRVGTGFDAGNRYTTLIEYTDPAPVSIAAMAVASGNDTEARWRVVRTKAEMNREIPSSSKGPTHPAEINEDGKSENGTSPGRKTGSSFRGGSSRLNGVLPIVLPSITGVIVVMFGTLVGVICYRRHRKQNERCRNTTGEPNSINNRESVAESDEGDYDNIYSEIYEDLPPPIPLPNGYGRTLVQTDSYLSPVTAEHTSPPPTHCTNEAENDGYVAPGLDTTQCVDIDTNSIEDEDRCTTTDVSLKSQFGENKKISSPPHTRRNPIYIDMGRKGLSVPQVTYIDIPTESCSDCQAADPGTYLYSRQSEAADIGTYLYSCTAPETDPKQSDNVLADRLM